MLAGIITSLVFLSGAGVVIALVLILAEKKILNYGPCRVTVNGGKKTLTVQGGGTLLAGLAAENIFVPSACGGRGTCAYCKVKVTAGGGVLGPVEAPALTPGEIKDGVRLSCQVKIRNDLQVEIPEELFSIRRFAGTLERRRPLTHDIVELRIALRDPAQIEFTAGQYVQLESQPYKGNDAVMRAYSISSSPSDKNHVELIVRRVPNGICTTWVFDHLREGQAVSFSGPYGGFRLSGTGAPALFIAGGSGMAPILSMLRRMAETRDGRRARYFFGALTQRDLFLTEELSGFEKALPDFRFVPALSQEPEGGGWRGERGIVTEVVGRRLPDLSGFEAYLCGSPGMIDACIRTLKAGGIPGDRIYYDKF